MIRTGTIVALKTDNETPTAKVIYVNAREMAVRVYRKNHLFVITNWIQAERLGRIIEKQRTAVVLPRKTVVVTDLLPRKPSLLVRWMGSLQGYQYGHHHRAMHMIKDRSGDPRMVRRWCRRKKFTGTLYLDGFLITRTGIPIYIDHYNRLKEMLCKR